MNSVARIAAAALLFAIAEDTIERVQKAFRVFVRQGVIDGLTLSPARDEPLSPQYGQVLGHDAFPNIERSGKGADRLFAFDQCAEDHQPVPTGQALEQGFRRVGIFLHRIQFHTDVSANVRRYIKGRGAKFFWYMLSFVSGPYCDKRSVMASLTQIEVLLPEFRAYAIAICASSDDAEDLVQDAIERALRTESRPTVLDELRPWMFRVIRNLHYDELRKRRVRREYLAVEKRLSDEAGISDAARDILIRMAFEKLPPDMREVLCLVDVMGLKYAEAAKVMDVANGTVMSRISRARKALLALVEGSDAADEIEKSAR
ncbi:RNA polymerase sigma factor [Marinovum algicola]|uniref:RNA polymerase sigma factor n=1 Tax=Marinovum TaxID=367771 RepID=UPI003BF88BFA